MPLWTAAVVYPLDTIMSTLYIIQKVVDDYRTPLQLDT